MSSSRWPAAAAAASEGFSYRLSSCQGGGGVEGGEPFRMDVWGQGHTNREGADRAWGWLAEWEPSTSWLAVAEEPRHSQLLDWPVISQLGESRHPRQSAGAVNQQRRRSGPPPSQPRGVGSSLRYHAALSSHRSAIIHSAVACSVAAYLLQTRRVAVETTELCGM